MKNVRELLIKDFTYDLPTEKIARYSLADRDQSKLLVYQNNEISSSNFTHLADFLKDNNMLVFNDTRVIHARLIFQKHTGASIEVFCLEPGNEYPDTGTAMAKKGSVKWKCLIGGASKWKNGTLLHKKVSNITGDYVLTAAISAREPENFVVSFSWEPKNVSFAEILQHAGSVPLPPYLQRVAEAPDSTRYQTVYARHDGSVAAPTAGLHFTNELMATLDSKKVQKEFVTLHVGAGTFKPVSAERIGDHFMHAEFIDVQASTIANIIKHLDSGIIAVGTTSLRTLESLYWIGVKIFEGCMKPDDLAVQQWDPYEITGSLNTKDSLSTILRWMEEKKSDRLITKTQILIAPGYQLRVAKALVTNFHQPQSTLLLLIAAITGHDWKKIYGYALDNNFRFLSYGDGCLLYYNADAALNF